MSTATLSTKSDLELQQDVLAELKWEPSVNANRIGVTVHEGIVTLTGTVPSFAEKLAAEKAAERVAGVQAIANDLKVEILAENEQSDEAIAAAAVNALKWNLFVRSKKIQVTVRDGRVTLEGEVTWNFQKEAAEESVRNLAGVQGVINVIKLKPRVSPDDVKARIEEALKRSAELDAQGVTVEVQGDGVVLRGTVRSFAERSAAEMSAWAAPGVSRVENHIHVEP
jgi:osmotically-inducible protein OsmY